MSKVMQAITIVAIGMTLGLQMAILRSDKLRTEDVYRKLQGIELTLGLIKDRAFDDGATDFGVLMEIKKHVEKKVGELKEAFNSRPNVLVVDTAKVTPVTPGDPFKLNNEEDKSDKE